MSTAPGSSNRAVAMGLDRGVAVQELGWDSDVDEELRDDIMDLTGEEFVYEAVEAVDVVLLWWRAEDGDLADGLVDALTDLASHGAIWLLTPKVGRPGYVDATDLAEAALTAGLSLANAASLASKWQAHKLVRPKGIRR